MSEFEDYGQNGGCKIKALPTRNIYNLDKETDITSVNLKNVVRILP